MTHRRRPAAARAGLLAFRAARMGLLLAFRAARMGLLLAAVPALEVWLCLISTPAP
ncbi:hypothetical protein ND808_10215 [Streptomyces sp. DR7-3]|uniref:hypothetical protein n=1 Tax=Streptomyces malaysiensis TaxID=92644 RepID=UPI002043B00E|nr:hypothetical protein [Streptomyces sp. DR7-3]MCM3806247.1 hypothetical protein [Streptomyces sp. DR7-3]